MKKIFLLILFLTVAFFLVPLPEICPPYGTIFYDKNGEIIHTFLSKDEQIIFKIEENEKIPEKIKIALVFSEDKRFYFHFGFDPLSLIRAAYVNIKNKKIVQGGSTITMQTIRILDPKPRKILIKLKEIIQAIKMELIFSKEEILKIYLSNVPMGGNVRGIKAASLKYFGKKMEDLTWAESSTLCAILKSPSKKDFSFIKKERDKILKKLYKYKIIKKEILESALKEPVFWGNFELPKKAPHFSFWLFKNKLNGNVKTTLDLSIQNIAEEVLNNFYPRLKSYGINECSIIILETATGKIRGYVGSPSFEEKERGQVDGVQAPRSTGSILKPFLYALALDKGILTQNSILPDYPVFFGDFKPENSERIYRGAVKFKEALINSLNIPAVWLLHKYGYENFYNFLKLAEFSTLYPDPKRYGLTLIIGGAEGKLIEITNLFRILSNYGVWSPYIFEEKKETKYKKMLLSKGSASIIYEVLQELSRPDEIYYQIYPKKNFFSWKTGTSFKQRDAWACGTNEDWTIGVWAGNFSGEGNQNIMGAKIAGPILFNLFLSLPKLGKEKVNLKGVKRVLVCKDSGYLPSNYCSDLEFINAPEKTKNLKICQYHKEYFVDLDLKYSFCSFCLDGKNFIKKSFFILPPEMKYYFKNLNSYEEIPPHNPECKKIKAEYIKIIYPENGSIIKIPKEYDGNYQKVVFKAVSNIRESFIFWLVDKKYIGKTKNNHIISMDLEDGEHTLQIIDEEGNENSVSFRIIKI